jgi:WD40 repeat protein
VRSGKVADLGPLTSSSVFSPDGNTLATTTSDKNGYGTALNLIDPATAKVKRTIPIHDKNASVYVARFSPDSKLMVVNYTVFEKAKDWKNYTSRFEVLECQTGQKIASLAAAPNEGHAAYFAPDGKTLAVSNWRSKEPSLLLFGIAENRVLRTIPLGKKVPGERLNATSAPVFSPDGKHLAIITRIALEGADSDTDPLDRPQPRIHVIDVASGEVRQTLVAPQGFSDTLCFSPHGQTLAVGNQGRVLLWDVSQRTKNDNERDK